MPPDHGTSDRPPAERLDFDCAAIRVHDRRTSSGHRTPPMTSTCAALDRAGRPAQEDFPADVRQSLADRAASAADPQYPRPPRHTHPSGAELARPRNKFDGVIAERIIFAARRQFGVGQ